VLEVALLHRSPGSDDQVLVSRSFTNMAGVDGGFPGDFDTQLPAPALTPACGDALVLHLKLASGSTPYTDFNPTLTTP
jgi:hypothetical protein